MIRCSGVPVFRCSGVPVFRCSGVVHCRIYLYLIKAAPHAAPLARRQRPGLCLGRPARSARRATHRRTRRSRWLNGALCPRAGRGRLPAGPGPTSSQREVRHDNEDLREDRAAIALDRQFQRNCRTPEYLTFERPARAKVAG